MLIRVILEENIQISKNEKSASGLKSSKNRIILLLCSNASEDNVIKSMLIIDKPISNKSW